MAERFKSPLIDQEFLKSSLLPMSIEERRRFEQNLIKYGLIDERDDVAQVAIASPLVVEPYGTLTTQTGEIRLKELAVGGANYVGFRAPDEVLGNQVWTLPSQDGDYGQFLQTLGNDRLQWGWPYWIKTGNDIYFLNNVAIGTTPSATYDFYVAGASAFVAPNTTTPAALFTGDVDTPSAIVKITNTSDVTDSVCLQLNRPLGDTAGQSGLIDATYDDLAHGMTTLVPTNVSFQIAHWTDATGFGAGDQGGFYVAGYSEGELCLGFEANYTTSNSDRTSAFSPVCFKIFKKTGTTSGVPSANDNLLSIAASASRVDPTPLFHFVYGPSFMLVGSSSKIFVNETDDANITAGLSLNQGSADDTILSLKSSDVAHGVTTLNETDTYGAFLKSTAASGGLKIRGFTEATDALLLMGVYTTDDTAKSTSGRAAVEVWGQKKSVATTQDPGANANIFGIFKNTAPAALWLCDVEGDTWQAGAITATQATLNIAAGTAPLVITSTTVCTNLNADLWDGYHAFQGDTLEPNGFEDRADSTITWDDGTLTLTITGTNFIVWYKGVRYLLNTDTSTIADASGLYFFYYEISGATLNLVNSTVWPGFDTALVATVYWNTTAGMDKGLVADERHGIIMDAATHKWAHETIGVRYESGLAGTFADSTFSIALGEIHDEDIGFSITPAQTACDVLYLDGSSTWKWLANQTVYYYTSGGNLYWNNGTTLTAAGANKYVAVWIFATTSPVRPIVSIIGQNVSDTLADARSVNTYQGLSLGSLPFKEMKILYRVILRNDVTPFEETQDLRSVSNISSGTYVATAHSTLTGLTTGDDHTQYVYCKLHATDTPAVTDDIDTYREGTLWIEQDAPAAYILIDNADGAAVWRKIPNVLDDIPNVDAAAPNDNDVLTWDAASSTWKAEASAGGAGAFLDLTDVTEADYVGHGAQFVRVNVAETGLEFTASSVAGHLLTSATHTDVDNTGLSDDDILRYDSASGTWKCEALPAAANHDLLSATHADTTASAVTRGSIIVADSTPKWAELAIGTANYVLQSDGTDAAWANPAHALLSTTWHSDTTAQGVTRGSIIYGNSTPKWDELTIGSSGYVLASDGTDIAWSLVPTHASRHQSGGADAIKLDDLAAADDNTDLNVSSSAHGLCPKSDGSALSFLSGAGTWIKPGMFTLLNESFDSLSTASINGQGSYTYFGAWATTLVGTTTFNVGAHPVSGKMVTITGDTVTEGSSYAEILCSHAIGLGAGTRIKFKMRTSDVTLATKGWYLGQAARTPLCQVYFRATSKLTFWNGSTNTDMVNTANDTWYDVEVLLERGTTTYYATVFVDGVRQGAPKACGADTLPFLYTGFYINMTSTGGAGNMDFDDFQIGTCMFWDLAD